MNESTLTNVSQRLSRVFYGWWVVAAASIQGLFGNGTISSGFSIFFQPIRQELGVSYAAMSLVFSMGRAEGGMGGPLVGWLVDKYGARPMILTGGLLASVGLILISRANAYWQVLALFVLVVSVGKTAGLGQTLMATVNQWFVRRRALALSTLMTSFAGGGAIVVPLLGFGIASIGWRDTLLYMGIFIAILTVIVSLVIRSKPEDIGLSPDGDRAPQQDAPEQGAKKTQLASQDFTVRQALATSAFWFLLIGLVARVSSTNAIIIHLFPILEDEGLSSQTAAFYASGMFFLAIPLRFVMGVAGDFIPPRKVLFVGMNIGAAGLLALLLFEGTITILVFMLALSVVEGITSANWILVSDYFGRARFATIMGVMSVFHNVGLFISPIFSGWIRDITGRYDLVMVTFLPMFVLGSIAFMLARKPTLPQESSQ